MPDWLNLSFVADIAGILGAIFALLAALQLFLDKRQRNKKITVILRGSGDNKIELPVAIRRAELTRSEVLGRIGMLNSGKRFDLSYINDPEFFRRLNEISEGKGDTTLTLVCSDDELKQFDRSNS